MSELNAKGFPTYGEFMLTLLATELASHHGLLARLACVRLACKVHLAGLDGEAHFHDMLDRILH